MVRRVGDVLARKASEHFVGRTEELSTLLAVLDENGPLVTHIHGVAGIGKSTLLEAFSSQARDRGAVVVHLDFRLTEPSPRGFANELGNAMACPCSTPEEASDRLGKLGKRVVLAVDGYELSRLLDTWIRQVFIPGLSDNVRVVLCSRLPPGSSWIVESKWQGLFRSMLLGPLNDSEALELLARVGVTGDRALRISRLARGHPLALRLAVAAVGEHPETELNEVAVQGIVQPLTNLYLSDVTDPEIRIGIQAASVIRCVTKSLLGAMLPEADASEVYDRLRTLSFVESCRDGLIVHEAVRGAVSTSLRCSDPSRYRDYRRAAWRQLRSEVSSAGEGDMWRYTADILYLLENPLVREAFFPSGPHYVTFDPARPEDSDGILAIAERHESRSAAEIIRYWWQQLPQCFQVTRDTANSVVGFYLMVELDNVPERLVAKDPLVRGWWQHLQDNPIPKRQTAVYVRRWLSRDCGELPSPVQGSCWLDAKKKYVELRRNLRRCYISVCDLETYGPTAHKLGFRVIEDASAAIDGVRHHLAVLDMGRNSIEGWLSGLVAAELGIEEDSILDADARELVLDSKRVGLTPLECGVLRNLCQREGKAVSRAELLEEVWGYEHDCGSNVVDVVVRSLRKKLGTRSTMIATVRGVGYRFRGA